MNPDKSKRVVHLTMAMAVLAAALLAPSRGLVRADAPQSPDRIRKVQPQVPIQAYAFDLQDVRLLEGPFQHAQQLDHDYLLSLDVDRLLHTFRTNAGLPSSAQPLGGWEEPKCEVRGHFVGHYLTACALMYASTGDERLKQKGDQAVAGLAACQAQIGTGYLSAYPEEFFDRVEKLERVWAPYYTLHKIYAGLLDMYVHCGNTQALAVCEKFADWVIARNDRLSDEQMEKMLGNEHGGMNEVLANLYAVTGQEKYLRIAKRFNHMAVIGPASEREDRLTGLHANTQIPKFVGTARQFEMTGEEWLRTASVFFWDTVAKERSYVIGGHSDGEMFSPKEKLSEAFGPSTTETCNTYNMLKLTRHLFCWTGDAGYADYYERALLNHILCSQNPETGMMCYYVPLRSGSRKVYNTPLDSFWCCTGTGVENHAKYGDSIYFHDGHDKLFVNLFIASELTWRDKGVSLRQETRFPDEASSRLTISCEKPQAIRLQVRHPFWATGGFEILVNGASQPANSQPGGWATVDRQWSHGDTVEVRLPMTLRTEAFQDNPHRFAVLHGPVVLCAEVEPGRPVPAVVVETERLLTSLQSVPGKPSTFLGPPEVFRIPGEPAGGGVTLEPFYKMHADRHYAVYWDQFTPEEWRAEEAKYLAEKQRQQELAARSIDSVTPLDEAGERNHKLEGERTGAGPFGNRRWRHAVDGGWFSYQLKVNAGQPQVLLVTYWGSDQGNRVFDILVDGQKLATQKLQNNRPDAFYDELYEIPAAMTQGKESVVVRFQAHAGAMAGGIFELRILKRE